MHLYHKRNENYDYGDYIDTASMQSVDLTVNAKVFVTSDSLAQTGLCSSQFRTRRGKMVDLVSNPNFSLPRDRMNPELDFVMRVETMFGNAILAR